MNDGLRAATAFIAWRLVSEADVAAVYDYGRGTWVQFSGDVTSQNVSIYDHARGATSPERSPRSMTMVARLT